MCSKYPSTQKLWKKAISYKKKKWTSCYHTTRTEAKKHRKPFAALKSRIWKKIHSIAPIYTAIICITYKIFSNTTGHFSSIPLNSKRYCNMELFKKDSIWRLEYMFFPIILLLSVSNPLSVPYQYWPAMDNNSCNVL